jgi:hypothetical protein
LEDVVGAQLKASGVNYEYEQLTIKYDQPTKKRRYTPDFELENGIIVETKGWLVTADRQKHLLVKAQFPDLDIRFVFSNPNARISKQSKTTYAQWCESKGFRYAKGRIPDAWLIEPLNKASYAAIRQLKEASE